MMIASRWCWSAVGCLVVVLTALSGCEKEQPQPSFNRDLGEDGAVLVLPASPRHDRRLLDGQADWRPFRPYEPRSEESAADGETDTAGGETADAAELEEAEADIRDMLGEYNGLVATGTVEDLLEFYVEDQHDALRSVIEAASTAAKKAGELRAALEAKSPESTDAIEAAWNTFQAAAPYAVNVGAIEFSSEELATGTGSVAAPKTTYRFPLVDDYWFIEIIEPADIAEIKAALDAAVGTYTGWLESLQSDGETVGQILEQIEATAPAAATREPPAHDPNDQPDSGERGFGEATGEPATPEAEPGTAEPEGGSGGG